MDLFFSSLVVCITILNDIILRGKMFKGKILVNACYQTFGSSKLGHHLRISLMYVIIVIVALISLIHTVLKHDGCMCMHFPCTPQYVLPFSYTAQYGMLPVANFYHANERLKTLMISLV